MPTLMLRDVPPALLTRIRRYTRARGLSSSAAGAELLAIALDHLDARAAGGRATAARRSPADRAAAAQRAARARWSQS